jgi:hypothetical protein
MSCKDLTPEALEPLTRLFEKQNKHMAIGEIVSMLPAFADAFLFELADGLRKRLEPEPRLTYHDEAKGKRKAR